MENIGKIEKALKIKFKNKKLVENAFVHRSYLNENPKFNLPSNERLEYLGDAALELVASH
jgi:ribonuclease-3